jgi:hypothetical protein
MKSHALESVALALVGEGKGILAADETVPTLTKRFDVLGIHSTEQSRRTYRKMLFTCPSAAEFILGVIMYDETIRQKSAKGTPLVPRPVRARRRPRRDTAQAQHGHPGKESTRQASVEEVAAATWGCLRCLVPAAWHRIPIGRPTGTPGRRSSERNQSAPDPEALEGQFLPRAGASRSHARGMAGARRELRGRPAGPSPRRPLQRGSECRDVLGRDGGGVAG